MSKFKWTKKKEDAVILLAQGHTMQETADKVGVAIRTLFYWDAEPEFVQEKDRLSLMVDISSRAERLRIAMRAVRQRVTSDGVETDKDLLDWLKFAQGETDGVKLDLAALAQAQASLAE